jgi:hypothetical protein
LFYITKTLLIVVDIYAEWIALDIGRDRHLHCVVFKFVESYYQRKKKVVSLALMSFRYIGKGMEPMHSSYCYVRVLGTPCFYKQNKWGKSEAVNSGNSFKLHLHSTAEGKQSVWSGALLKRPPVV